MAVYPNCELLKWGEIPNRPLGMVLPVAGKIAAQPILEKLKHHCLCKQGLHIGFTSQVTTGMNQGFALLYGYKVRFSFQFFSAIV
jgi:hypothetical protein